MRKQKLFLMGLFLMGMLGCTKGEQDPAAASGLSSSIIGTDQSEIHQVLGKPSGTLSGFTGDLYYLDNGTQVIVYYDSEMKVEQVKIKAEDGKDTLTLEPKK